jgi:hypothetical protein
MPVASTLSSKRSIASSALSTPPTSPNAAKRIRLTYGSTNEALKDLNMAKEEASLSHLIAEGISPVVVNVGKGRYKLQWDKRDRTFLAIGPLADHDCLIKKKAFRSKIPLFSPFPWTRKSDMEKPGVNGI